MKNQMGKLAMFFAFFLILVIVTAIKEISTAIVLGLIAFVLFTLGYILTRKR